MREAVVRRKKPAVDALEDWDESDEWDEPEVPLPKARPKSSKKKKKRRSAGISVDVGRWFESIRTWDVGPILLQALAVVLLGLFGAGFWYPAAAAWFMFLFMVTTGVTVIGAWIGLFVIAAREHVMCMILCLFLPYKIGYIISRWDRTSGVVSVWFLALLGGWGIHTGTKYAYEAAGVDWRRGDMAVLGEMKDELNPPQRRPLTPAAFAPPPNLMSPTFPTAQSGKKERSLGMTRFAPSSVSIPDVFELGETTSTPGVAGTVCSVRVKPNRNYGPGTGMSMRLRLPPGEHEVSSLPCILIAPAGSTLLTGMPLDGIEHTAETAPYVAAGYAVVEYSIDGECAGNTPDELSRAYPQFKLAMAGVLNGRNALEFVLHDVRPVNPDRIFTAGHSSAAVLALLLAEHDPRIRGCLAYAPACDVEARLRPNLAQMDAERLFPGVFEFIQRSSPTTHISHLGCPVFLFHARDDDNVPVSMTAAFHAQLQAAGKQSTLVEVPTGGHYNSMVQEGIPAGLRWLQQLPANQPAGK